MQDRRDMTAGDGEMWPDAVEGVKKLERRRHPAVAEDAGKAAPARTEERLPCPAAAVREGANPPAARPPASGFGGTLSRRELKKLRAGGTEPEARLDLHQRNEEQAFAALAAFLPKCRAKGKRTVLVITGKGRGEEGGVLNRMFSRWLEHESLASCVVCYERAAPRHGGDGAYYVYLRRL
jgi:DNA-nicking Smr family endonuclease